MCDTQVALEDLSLTRMWSFQMLGTVYTVVLLLESGRDTVDLYCNDEELEYDTHVQDGVIQFDFLISGSHKARIRCCPQMGSLQHTLIVAGEEVPECE